MEQRGAAGGGGAAVRTSPRISANVVSRLFFWWLKPLFYRGNIRDLRADDLHEALPSDGSEMLGSRLEKYWKDEVEIAQQISISKKPKLVNAIRKAFGWSYLFYAGHMLVSNCLRVLQPFLLGLLIQYFEPGSATTRRAAYYYASGIVVLTLLHSLLKHHIDFATLEFGMRLRIACSSMIYKKMLKLSNASLAGDEGQGGHIINLLSNDVARFDPVFMYLHYVWLAPLQLGILAYMIWRNVGYAAFIGVFVMSMETLPVQVYLGLLTSKLRTRIAEKTDERVRLMTEIINGIHVIKMYTWEKPFERLVSLARRYEIDVITSMSYLRGINTASNAFIDRTCLYFTLIAFLLAGNVITADVVFSTVQYFTILQNVLAYNYPRAMLNASEASVSLKRIEKFLKLDETKIPAPLLSPDDNGSIKLINVTAKWSTNSIANTIYDFNMTIRPGQLHAVAGPVGAGKSSFLQILLGELKPSTGEMRVNGTTSYASQRPWLFPGTVLENIIFDQPYREEKYRQVLQICALERDLRELPLGDRSQVGERGTNLSGGQCARVNLARAVYRDADIYILDDPFASLDPSVCTYVFNECINGYLRDKTRIFVTHQVQYLKEAHTVFLINNGQLEAEGHYDNFPKKESLNFLNISEQEERAELIEEVENNVQVNHVENNDPDAIVPRPNDDDIQEEPPETQELLAKGKLKLSIFPRYFRTGNSICLLASTLAIFILAQVVRSGSDYYLAHWTYQEELRLNSWNNEHIKLMPVLPINSTGTLSLNTTDRITSTTTTAIPSTTTTTPTTTTITTQTTTLLPSTTVDPPTTLSYSSNTTWNPSTNTEAISSMAVSPTTLLLNTVETFISSTTPRILPTPAALVANATSNETSQLISNINFGDSGNHYFREDASVIIYGCILLGCVITAIAKVILFYKVCMNSGRNIHDEMFASVIKAPIKFFDKQTSGQILNRFSKDTGSMDEILPITMHESIEVFSVIMGVVVQVLIINWTYIAPMIVTGCMYWQIRKLYLPAAQSIKRLEGAAKSPVLSHALASLEGLKTIRSGRSQTDVARRFDARQDEHTRAYFLSIASSSAFGLWLDIVSVVLVTFVTYGCLLAENTTFAGGVGLAITQTLMLCGMLQRGIRQSAETFTQMTSVERILQYTNVEAEDSDDDGATKPEATWPSCGKIEFKDFGLRYVNNAEPVIKDINLVIEPGTKVGIVGRTGAGKTSLISALFRLVRSEGRILIDGVDTRKLELHELRKRLAVIPQESVLFSTTLRDNLDPYHMCDDKLLWEALECVELQRTFVPLDHPVVASGNELSSGQRQQLCLARALVKNSRILVLDEATASCDPATDDFIRRTIRDRFAKSTVLTVAHRLESVIDSERILVVANGQVVEYDHPHTLLQKADGHFVRMAREGGNKAFEKLKKAAEEAYIRLNKKDNQVSTTETVEERTNNVSEEHANGVIEERANGVVITDDRIGTAEDSVDKLQAQ